MLNLKTICITFLLFTTASILDRTVAAEISPEPATAIAEAEELGRLLFDAEVQGQPVDEVVATNARSKVNDFCDFEYKVIPVLVKGQPHVFLIAQPSNPGMIVFGRHYRVSGQLAIPSTKSCLAVPPGPPGSVGSVTTHILSPYPTEFHVYLSLLHRMPIYVGIGKETWSVEDGKIRILPPR